MASGPFVCRHCGCKQSKVTDTRIRTFEFRGIVKDCIHRRRICRNCKLPYTTVEYEEREDLRLAPDVPLPPLPSQAPPLPPKKTPRRKGKGDNPYL